MTALLDATDSQRAMLAELVAGLVAAEQTLSSMQAARDGLLALAGRLAVDIARQGRHPDHGDLAIRTVAAEIGAAQRASDRAVERRMSEASWLVERFPAVWEAQGRGLISAAHARAILDAGAHLHDASERSAFADDAVALAQTTSPNRLRPLVRRLAERFQERTVTERHRDAREQRRVWVKDAGDGMADLGMHGPAALVHGMFDRLSQMAHAVQQENARAERGATEPSPATPDTRTVDQLRADLLSNLVLTGTPAGHDTADGLLGELRARVEVTVPVLTLLRDDHPTAVGAPAELDGQTPIDAETARHLTGGAAGWDRVLTHPISGAMLAVDRYRPSEELRRHLRARDQHCRFPGCGLAARKSDLDHSHDAAHGGKTEHRNLATLCRRHHTLKHHSPWQVRQRPGGLLEWTSPAGRSYLDRPPPRPSVVFAEAGVQDGRGAGTGGGAWDAGADMGAAPF
ncbi:HNH endonuclease signature motif containing protein [Microbacterium sufflavum]|uniref:HNH endonuclease n=1 Tax=Microbacterium sufflavum TaxID=2851649 RepID=A0ABY4IJ91_9MICO|nr:HNH endonuclease signature motif containing protein [Microbacterium sufflavum]UPL12669.1 HNH endonuclease [Microbacterium sufflavum]